MLFVMYIRGLYTTSDVYTLRRYTGENVALNVKKNESITSIYE